MSHPYFLEPNTDLVWVEQGSKELENILRDS